MKRWIAKLFRRPPVPAPRPRTAAEQTRLNLERLFALAGRPQDDPLWQVVLSLADEHLENELRSALAPSLTGGDRHYNAGRAASAADFVQVLRDLRLRAEQEARKAKNR